MIRLRATKRDAKKMKGEKTGMKTNGEWIEQAVAVIEAGIARKLEKDNVTVYTVGDNLIRIDIKREKRGEKHDYCS